MIDSLPLLFAALTTIFGWSFFSFWSAIPAGIALMVPPILVGLTTTISYGCGVLLVVIIGEPIRKRLQHRMQSQADDDDAQPNRMVGWVIQAWERFGLIGLAILAPMTVGAQIGAVIGLGFGAHPWRLVIVMTFGAGAWALVLTVVFVAGIMTIT